MRKTGLLIVFGLATTAPALAGLRAARPTAEAPAAPPAAAPAPAAPPAAAPPPAAPPPATDFCRGLSVYVDAARVGFTSLRGEENAFMHGLWAVNAPLAGAESCMISSLLGTEITCWYSGSGPDALASQVGACLPGWTRSDKGDGEDARVSFSKEPGVEVKLSTQRSGGDLKYAIDVTSTVQPGSAPPVAAVPASTDVTDADVQAKIARIQQSLAESGYQATPPPPRAADFCSGLTAYVAAAPDLFKAVREDDPNDDEDTTEWDASPGLPGWDSCEVREAFTGFLSTDAGTMRTYLACSIVHYAQTDSRAAFGGLMHDVESCMPTWKRVPRVRDDATEHWKVSYQSGSAVWINVEHTLEGEKSTLGLTVYRD